MPLKTGKENVGYNISELKNANQSKPEGKKRSMAQILAISLEMSRKRNKNAK